MGLVQEFREFTVKGNAVDLAVGVVLGAAFGGIVTSLVDDVLRPPLSYLFGGVDFTNLFWTSRERVVYSPAVFSGTAWRFRLRLITINYPANSAVAVRESILPSDALTY